MSIASYMGGVRPWEGEDDDRWGPQAMDDGLLEVVSIRGTLHLGQLQVGLGNGAVKLAQGARVVITTSTDLPMQTVRRCQCCGCMHLHFDSL
jgi:diacylglycerol kinase (ATP)